MTAVQSDESAIPKRCSLPSMLPPVSRRRRGCGPRPRAAPESRAARRRRRRRRRDDEHQHHRDVEGPALAPVADHPPEGVRSGRPGSSGSAAARGSSSARSGSRTGRRVDVEEAAAVGAELLDRLLGGDRPDGHASGCRRRAWRRRGSRRGSGSRPGRRGPGRRGTRSAAGCRASERTRSTQKLPSAWALRRRCRGSRRPATAIPTAAETKFWTARPAIWRSRRGSSRRRSTASWCW